MQQTKGTATITGLSHDGRGIAHIEGKTTFISDALIGECVEFEYVKKRSRFDEAKMINLLKASEERATPDCDFFGICGGCSLQHMHTSAQVSFKQSVLMEQLQHIGRVKPEEVIPPTLAPTKHYRRKARLGVKYVDKKQKLLIGFREKDGRYLADIESCTVLHKSVGENIPLLREFIMQLHAFRHIPQLEVAVSDDVTALIIRHLVPLDDHDIACIEEFAHQHRYHIYLQPQGPQSAYLLYPKNIQERLRYYLQDYNLELLFHPTDFTQINAPINQKLIALAIDLLQPQPNENILDLFCGIGNFSLPLARLSAHVVGVEGSELMVGRGYENAAHNNITNIEFLCKNLAMTLHADDSSLKNNFDSILLDPPRTGAWDVMMQIPHWNPARVVYVSCNPATLARDVGYLCEHGYMLKKVGVLDMFPHTSHVESIALLLRA